MVFLKEVTEDILKKEDFLLYIHTPFCGTCHIARSMLEKIETIHNQDLFFDMNASYYPEFMQAMKVESVPCLLIKKDNEVKEKIYAFRSVANIYQFLMRYEPDLFKKST